MDLQSMCVTMHVTYEYRTASHVKEKTTTQEIKYYSKLSQNRMVFFPEKQKSRINRTATLNMGIHAKFIQTELPGSLSSFSPRCPV